MKKSFMYIFFIIIFIVFLGNLIIKNSNIRKKFMTQTFPVIRIVNEESIGIENISYVNIIKYKLMSENIFIELPEDKVELANENIEGEVLFEDNNKSEEDNDESQIKSVTLDWKNELRNETKYKIDIEKLKNENLDFSLKNTEIIIYHTHTTETYSKSDKFDYIASGEFRTLDKNASVVRIGNYLKELLEKENINVYHDTDYYDYPSYNLSYSKAGKAILALTKKYTSANIVLDIHRDALSNQNEIYRPIINIDGEDVAQILLVVGTNQGGLKHPNWRENLKFALKLQQIANQKYPGLCRYVSLRKERFNQQVAKGAIIVEMGATGNTMDEVLRATKLFSEILLEVIE